MRLVTLRRWLCFLATGACLLQTTGCPDAEQIGQRAATSVQSFINGVVGLYVNAGVDSVFGT